VIKIFISGKYSGHTVYPSGAQLVIQTLILQRYQNKVLRATVNVPWNIPNKVLHVDLKVQTIREEISKFSVKYRDKITTQPNEMASTLLEEEEPRRLQRFKPTNLTTTFS